MTVCENCGNNIPEDAKHAPDTVNQICAIHDKTTGSYRGISKKQGVLRDLYRKKN